MSEFKNKSMTTKGLELLSKAMSGGKLEFTRIEMGSGTFSDDISSAENLVEVKQNLQLTNIVRKGGQVTLSAILKIEDITSEYDWTEIGVYAKGADDVEVLYMYGYTTNSSFISKDSLNEKLINVTVIVSNAAEVTAVINSSVVYLTQEALEEHNKSDSAHSDIRELIEEVKTQVENIDVSWDGIIDKPEAFPPSEHTHDDRYYTESEIDAKLNTKANTSHTHSKSQITDFPTSLPANGGNADTVDGKHASDFLQTTGGTVNGDVTVTQSLSARKLQLTDYGTPLECGKYLDFHDVGSSNSDYDGRLYVHGAHLAYANGTGVTMVITEEINNLNSKVLEMEKKLGGDYMGKEMVLLTRQNLSTNIPFTYTNSKGGILRVGSANSGSTVTLTVDGSVISSGRSWSDICNIISYADGYYGQELIIPFNSSVSLTCTGSGIVIYPVAYVNK